MRLIVVVFVLGEDMEDMKDVLKLCLGLWWEVFWKERFVWNVDFVEILNNKVLKIFSEILVIFWLVYQEACVNRPVRRNTGWCGAICGVIAWQIWHTLAEVKIFIFLFVIKLFLNCCCSINVLYCFAIFLFSFAICSLCIKIFICCRVCRRDRYWDNRHS